MEIILAFIALILMGVNLVLGIRIIKFIFTGSFNHKTLKTVAVYFIIIAVITTILNLIK